MKYSLNSYCIMCGKRRKGYEVEEDLVIKSIRRIKKVFGIEKKNKLVVCKECYPRYLKERKKFEDKQKHFAILLTIFFLIVFIFSPDKLSAVFFFLIFSFLFLILLIPYYVPKIKDEEKVKEKQKTK
ncbi:MAG: hypothetical protein ACP5HJ_00505 [Candidatus Micrarchaeia archaeon]